MPVSTTKTIELPPRLTDEKFPSKSGEIWSIRSTPHDPADVTIGLVDCVITELDKGLEELLPIELDAITEKE